MLQKTDSKRWIRQDQIDALSPSPHDHKAFSIPMPKRPLSSDEIMFNKIFPDIEEWALEEESEPQTFLDFICEFEEKLQLTKNRRTIFIVPLDEGIQKSRVPLESLVQFATAYFDLPVEVQHASSNLHITSDSSQHFWLSEYPLETTENEFGDHCFDIQCILDILSENIPHHAYCVLGITTKDIYEYDEFHDENVVMGGGTGDLVGVLSLYRFDASVRLQQFKNRHSSTSSMRNAVFSRENSENASTTAKSTTISRENSQADAISRRASQISDSSPIIGEDDAISRKNIVSDRRNSKSDVISSKHGESDVMSQKNTGGHATSQTNSKIPCENSIMDTISLKNSEIDDTQGENLGITEFSQKGGKNLTSSRRRFSESEVVVSQRNSDSDSASRKHKHILLETCKTLVHETLHMFGLDHCTHFICVMNANVSPENNGKDPIHLCPICLKKLHHVVGFDIEKRYKKLLRFYMENDWHNEVSWLTKRLDLLK